MGIKGQPLKTKLIIGFQATPKGMHILYFRGYLTAHGQSETRNYGCLESHRQVMLILDCNKGRYCLGPYLDRSVSDPIVSLGVSIGQIKHALWSYKCFLTNEII